ncbi:MAG TPA: hypothetical protein PKA00_20460 [Saprospiraceae bacterium]|nr:hypothetical protein [Saprospiraceae bacterium]HMQ85295.1 hypothetical protein [Saprospiraceae bacterium]
MKKASFGRLELKGSEKAIFNITCFHAGQLTIQVLDQLGRTSIFKKWDLQQGQHNVFFSTAHLKGEYNVWIDFENESTLIPVSLPPKKKSTPVLKWFS